MFNCWQFVVSRMDFLHSPLIGTHQKTFFQETQNTISQQKSPALFRCRAILALTEENVFCTLFFLHVFRLLPVLYTTGIASF